MIFAEAGSSVRAVWREAPSCAVGWRVDCVRVAEATQSGLAAVMVLDCGDNVLKMRFSKMKRSGGLPESRCCNTPERGDRWFRNACGWRRYLSRSHRVTPEFTEYGEQQLSAISARSAFKGKPPREALFRS